MLKTYTTYNNAVSHPSRGAWIEMLWLGRVLTVSRQQGWSSSAYTARLTSSGHRPLVISIKLADPRLQSRQQSFFRVVRSCYVTFRPLKKAPAWGD